MGNYFITGANGGMGAAIRRALLQAGHHVWGIDRRPAAGVISADITNPTELQAAFERVRAEAGKLDGIIHTAGVYDLNSLVEMPEEDFIRDFQVNLFGMFRVNRLFLPLLKEHRRIVIVSSELAPLHPLPFTGIYAITKTAVEQYAAALRMEVQLLGHQVIVIRPGAVLLIRDRKDRRCRSEGAGRAASPACLLREQKPVAAAAERAAEAIAAADHQKDSGVSIKRIIERNNR